MIKDLLRVLRSDGPQQPTDAGDESGRCHRGDPLIDRADVAALRTASRQARHADAIRIDLGAGQQVINRANTVPGEVTGNRSSGQKTLNPGMRVLRG